jgi:hypothetical protein
MQIPREHVTHFLKERGQSSRIAEAEALLPDPVDTEEQAGHLAELGIDVEDIAHRGLND